MVFKILFRNHKTCTAEADEKLKVPWISARSEISINLMLAFHRIDARWWPTHEKQVLSYRNLEVEGRNMPTIYRNINPRIEAWNIERSAR